MLGHGFDVAASYFKRELLPFPVAEPLVDRYFVGADEGVRVMQYGSETTDNPLVQDVGHGRTHVVRSFRLCAWLLLGLVPCLGVALIGVACASGPDAASNGAAAAPPPPPSVEVVTTPTAEVDPVTAPEVVVVGRQEEVPALAQDVAMPDVANGDVAIDTTKVLGVDLRTGTLFVGGAVDAAAAVHIPTTWGCDGEWSGVVGLGTDGTQSAFAVPGLVVERFELGWGDVGFVDSSCNGVAVRTRILREGDGLLVSSHAGQEAHVLPALPGEQSYLPYAVSWLSDRMIGVTELKTGRLVGIDLLEDPSQLLRFEKADWMDAIGDPRDDAVGGRFVLIEPVVLALPHTSTSDCLDPAVTPQPSLGIWNGTGLAPISVDPNTANESFRGISRPVVGPDSQILWSASCHTPQFATSVWGTSFDRTVRAFDEPTLLLDGVRAAELGWNRDGISDAGVLRYAFDTSGDVVVWARSDLGIEMVTLSATGKLLSGPHLIASRTPGPPPGAPEKWDYPEVVELPDLDVVGFSRLPVGSAERNGRVFYAAGQGFPGRQPEGKSCDDGITVFSLGIDGTQGSARPVGVVPGARLDTFFVDATNHFVAESWCDESGYITVGTFDDELGQVDSTTIRTWVVSEDPGGSPAWTRAVSGGLHVRPGLIRSGDYELDITEPASDWTLVRPPIGVGRLLGISDSGRFQYWGTSGLLKVVGAVCDSYGVGDLRVYDTETNTTQFANETGHGSNAVDFVFGPDDEVAWLVGGGECGSSLFLARVDWDQGGLITEIYQIDDSDFRWSLGCCPGSPGADAIAFTAEGSLVVWGNAGGNGTDNTIEAIVLDLDECDTNPRCLPVPT